MRGRSQIEGAVLAGRLGGQYAPPEPVPADEDFAGGKREPSAEDFRDGLAEQGTVGGHEDQVKIAHFQAFISGLSMAEILRVLDLPETNAAMPPAKIPTILSAVGLFWGNPGSNALYKEK